MEVTISPGRLAGKVAVPGSKSMAHRGLIGRRIGGRSQPDSKRHPFGGYRGHCPLPNRFGGRDPAGGRGLGSHPAP